MHFSTVALVTYFAVGAACGSPHQDRRANLYDNTLSSKETNTANTMKVDADGMNAHRLLRSRTKKIAHEQQKLDLDGQHETYQNPVDFIRRRELKPLVKAEGQEEKAGKNPKEKEEMKENPILAQAGTEVKVLQDSGNSEETRVKNPKEKEEGEEQTQGDTTGTATTGGGTTGTTTTGGGTTAIRGPTQQEVYNNDYFRAYSTIFDYWGG
jgi:hypothetical protein